MVIGIIAFTTLWILYRNNPPRLSDPVLNGRGQFYPVAIHQVFTGLYFMELSLAGLFFLVRDSNGGAPCTGQAIIMVFATIATIIFHSTIDHKGKLGWRSLLSKIRKPTFRHCQADKGLYEERAKSPAQTSDSAVHVNSENPLIRPVIWLPMDRLGIAANETYHMEKYSRYFAVSTKGAYLDRKGSIVLQSGPPDQLR